MPARMLASTPVLSVETRCGRRDLLRRGTGSMDGHDLSEGPPTAAHARQARVPVPSHPLRWLPEFWGLTRKRFRPQGRVMVLSVLVGVIAGLGAIVFYLACQLVFHFALEDWAGYRPNPPGGETPVFAESTTPFRPWMLLLVPAIGGLVSGLIVFTIAPEAE